MMQNFDKEQNIGFDHTFPLRLLFGTDRLKTLTANDFPGKKAFVIFSGEDNIRQAGYREDIKTIFEGLGIDMEIFTIPEGNVWPDIEREILHTGLSGCDFVTGMGSGRIINIAKGVAYSKKLPAVVIPTTIDSGTAYNGIIIAGNEGKSGTVISDIAAQPCLTIVDTLFPATLPHRILALYGVTALSRAVCSCVAAKANVISRTHALKSLEILFENLPKAVRNSNDIEARQQMSLASVFSGMAFYEAGAMSDHALALTMCRRAEELPFNVALAIISEAYLTHFADVCEADFIEISDALSVKKVSLHIRDKAFQFVKMFSKLLIQSGISNIKMSEYGITQDDINGIAADAVELYPGFFNNDPVRMSNDEIVDILRLSYK